ncbi:hypothetical protein BU15DRAFT_65161 [Melanogaster broomeanus]|nr:hypothetical protein BU15DRAFT_65161 [Melanogaster broomeanus]
MTLVMGDGGRRQQCHSVQTFPSDFFNALRPAALRTFSWQLKLVYQLLATLFLFTGTTISLARELAGILTFLLSKLSSFQAETAATEKEICDTSLSRQYRLQTTPSAMRSKTSRSSPRSDAVARHDDFPRQIAGIGHCYPKTFTLLPKRDGHLCRRESGAFTDLAAGDCIPCRTLRRFSNGLRTRSKNSPKSGPPTPHICSGVKGRSQASVMVVFHRVFPCMQYLSLLGYIDPIIEFP